MRRLSVAYAAGAAAPAIIFLSHKFHILGTDQAAWMLFVAAASWGLVILQSFSGWGWLVARGLLGLPESGWLHPATGLALAIALGGWLNLFSAVSVYSLAIFVWTGLGAYAVSLFLRAKTQDPDLRKGQPSSRIAVLLSLFVVVALGWRYVEAVGWIKFNDHDDYQGYLVFVEKLLQLGSLGEDPFSERRLIGGVGSQYFLLSLVASEFPHRFLHILDPGIAVLMITGMVTSVIPESGIRVKLAMLALGASVALLPIPIVNISAAVIVVPLLLAMWLLFDDCHKALEIDPSASLLSRAMLIGLCAASACSLKNTFIPYVGISVIGGASGLVLRWPALWKKALGWTVLAGVVAGGTIGPWMVDLHRSSGTYLYPLLSKGYHGSVYGGTYLTANAEFLQAGRIITDLRNWLIDPFLRLPVLLTVALFCHTIWRQGQRGSAMLLPAGIFLAALISVVGIGFATGTYGTYRYTFPFVLASLLAGLIVMVRRVPVGGWPAIPLASAALLACFGLASLAGHLGQAVPAVMARVHGQDLVPEERRIAYADLSAHLPRDGAVLTRLDLPFLLRLRRDVFIADYPGGSSPPPGMPAGSDAGKLQRYLVGQGVRYVAWDYATQARFTRAKYGKRLLPGAYTLDRTEAKHTFEFQDAVDSLRATRPLVFDRYGIAIIDLVTEPQRAPR